MPPPYNSAGIATELSAGFSLKDEIHQETDEYDYGSDSDLEDDPQEVATSPIISTSKKIVESKIVRTFPQLIDKK